MGQNVIKYIELDTNYSVTFFDRSEIKIQGTYGNKGL
jgi:hypothetical protein